ncbi:hypothetical protein J40TS1_42210 [Paenibacillus montaniterrae]|uniref:Uncharacterized protein n=1 Tax=Paenibacillus montaniterrae TaxID=429341 RepID=A0A920D141_9BACL|nr:hypothetical protein [Paenibacillus montaniterrae]GIP18579.1 hypothetical protein J40TS1_42210 [Paenibacillus montaniterrae]
MEQWQTILRVKGAAGNISLLARQRGEGNWEFYRSHDLSEPQQEPIIVHSFPEALSLLGQSWKYLSPEYIHPEFKQQVWRQLSGQGGLFNRSNWRKACL